MPADPTDLVLPELQPVLQLSAAAPPMDFGDIPSLRAQSDEQVVMFTSLYVPEAPEVTTTIHRAPVTGGTIDVRVHRPAGEGALPALVYFHGGGWILGSAMQTDVICRRLADVTGSVVASVDYRLAPEHPVPGPAEDCYEALAWVVANAEALAIDPSDVAVGGQSAGGNLAAAVALMCRDRGGPALVAQWLDVPGLDLTVPEDEAVVSFGQGFGLNVRDVHKTVALYLGGADPTHAYTSPLLAPDLSGLPPATITVAGCDMLRDQGRRYADALAAAGVPVRFTIWDGHLHATMSLTNLAPSCRDYEAAVVAGLAEARAMAASTGAGA
ncbi:MAG TPA: alpha/beta hydrolase [Acidimicrobiales bacterium]|nr:alpha/beta hydrolase [Acidimicrobiales bacterium]